MTRGEKVAAIGVLIAGFGLIGGLTLDYVADKQRVAVLSAQIQAQRDRVDEIMALAIDFEPRLARLEAQIAGLTEATKFNTERINIVRQFLIELGVTRPMVPTPHPVAPQEP